MSNPTAQEKLCADCGGIDLEWMRRCDKHGLEYCRGCSCPACEEEKEEIEYYEEHAPKAQDFL